MTNFENIKNQTIEEMSDWIDELFIRACNGAENCEKCILRNKFVCIEEDNAFGWLNNEMKGVDGH